MLNENRNYSGNDEKDVPQRCHVIDSFDEKKTDYLQFSDRPSAVFFSFFLTFFPSTTLHNLFQPYYIANFPLLFATKT